MTPLIFSREKDYQTWVKKMQRVKAKVVPKKTAKQAKVGTRGKK